jgi:4-amino-4-deoxy-L-arabinose transferase-like glycosyltransferase
MILMLMINILIYNGFFRMKSKNLLVFALLGGVGFLLLLNLGGRHLENRDYLRYAEVAREMIRSGDWIVPRFNGEIYLHKPPFLFWLIALPSNIYGAVTPFLARLPSAFFAWIGALVVYLWGRRIWDEDRDGLIAAGILISSGLYFTQGRLARTDMVFSVLILLSLYFFYLSYQKEKNYGFAILCCVFMAMAALTKGPIGLVFPFLIILFFLLRQRRLRLLIQREFLLGYLTMIFLFGLWMIPFIHRVSWDSALSVWQETRILTRYSPFYVYGYRIWIDFAPWSIFLPFLIYYYWKKAKSQDEEFLILWVISLYALLTLSPARSFKYILPAFPALALLTGGFLRKRPLSLFYVIFFSAILFYHGHEYILIKQNEIRKPGAVLFRDLEKYRDKDMIGYQMNTSILGKINFYEDRVISQINQVDVLKEMARRGEGVFILTTERGLQELIENDFLITSIKKIDHPKGSIFVANIRTVKGR